MNRRQFIKGAAATAAVASVPLPEQELVPMLTPLRNVVPQVVYGASRVQELVAYYSFQELRTFQMYWDQMLYHREVR